MAQYEKYCDRKCIKESPFKTCCGRIRRDFFNCGLVLSVGGRHQVNVEQAVGHLHIRDQPKEADSQTQRTENLYRNKAALQQKQSLDVSMHERVALGQQLYPGQLWEVQHEKIPHMQREDQRNIDQISDEQGNQIIQDGDQLLRMEPGIHDIIGRQKTKVIHKRTHQREEQDIAKAGFAEAEKHITEGTILSGYDL